MKNHEWTQINTNFDYINLPFARTLFQCGLMSYQRIDPFPEDAATFGSSELDALGRIWHEKKEALQGTGVFQDFLKKLQREWAIETGIIERLYTWDRGVTEVLIEQGIDATLIVHRSGVRRNEADHVKALIDDQLSVIEGLFSYVKGEQPLTEHFCQPRTIPCLDSAIHQKPRAF